MTVKDAVRHGTGIGVMMFLIVAGLIAALTAYVLVVPVNTADFETTTGVSWDDFSAIAPEVADYLTREARLLAVGFLGLSGLAGAIAWGPMRHRDPRVNGPLWIFPAALAGAGLVFVTGDGAILGYAYLGAALVAALGLILAGRSSTK